MKTLIMKTIKALLILVTLSTFSCNSDDDSATSDSNTQGSADPVGFTYFEENETPAFFETEYAFLSTALFDSDAFVGVPDTYTLYFSNGHVYDGASIGGTAGEVMPSIDVTEFVKLEIKVVDNTVLQTGDPIAVNTTYNLSDESLVITGVVINSTVPQTIIEIDGVDVEFGDVDIDDAIFHIASTVGNTVTINEIDIDTNTPSNNTVDLDYTFVNTSGETISGHYKGAITTFED